MSAMKQNVPSITAGLSVIVAVPFFMMFKFGMLKEQRRKYQKIQLN